MNEEKKVQIKVFIKVLVVVAFSFLYALGGIEMKWLRRFVAPAFLCISSYLFSRDWRYFVKMPFMMISLSLGYGGDQLWTKIARRGIFGLSNGITSSTVNIWSKRWLLVAFQVVLCVSTIVIFGVWNPLPARAEETLIGLIIGTVGMLSVKDA